MVSLQQRGFTLIEMLVVVVIIGVLLGITLLSPITGSLHKVVQGEASRLQVLFNQVRDKAAIENVYYGFSIDHEGYYRWWVLPANSREWVILDESPYQPYLMPESLSLSLNSLETSRPFEFDEESPSVVFHSDYQVTPFRLHIIPVENRKQSLYLITDGLSDIERVRE
ncbi:prepilin-type N-terminal cleavage/methylation domain-containing protein [Endozoicomonas sp.]|uniref:prepilin-type N-terminal cleavage/methylation domain-containing protein n=1 Tax=Endozoicomonas sp. TaxID=1892382 RepID=UPI003AF74D2B